MHRTVPRVFLALMCMLLLGSSAAAQSSRENAYTLERFAPERLVLNSPAGVSRFQLSPAHILVQFREDVPIARQREILAAEAALLPLGEEMMLAAPRVVVGSMPEGSSLQEVVEILGRLNTLPEVRYANPFLRYRDGAELGIQDRFHVRLRSAADRATLEAFAAEHGAEIIDGNRYDPDIHVLRVTGQATDNAFELAARFQRSGLFAWAEPDFLRLLERMNTNDTYLSHQWAVNNSGSAIQYNGTPGADMDVFAAWATTTGSSSVRVAIIDEGVDLVHPDLMANLDPGYDATGLGSAGAPQNNDAHGTNCAGIVAAVGNNNLGIAGVAYGCRIVPVRVAYGVGPYWATSDAILADGINWAWSNGGADVLSNSWGGGSPSALINGAIDNAVNFGRAGKGATVLFSAGNGNSYVKYPANYNTTIAVAAMSMCDQRKSPTSCDGEYWWGSDYGTNVDVAAPGVKIYATDISGSAGYSATDYFATFNGTSSACPNAAAVVALIYSVNPALTHQQARDILETTTEKVGGYAYTNNVAGQPNGSWSNELGYGRVNAAYAVKAANISICLTETEPPTITAPSAVTVLTAPGACAVPAAAVNLGTPTVDDNCPQTLVVTNDAPTTFPAGSTVVTWTATDGAGNKATAMQSVTVVDAEVPVITACATGLAVESDAQDQAVIPDLRGQIQAADNCTLPANLQIAQDPVPNTVLDHGVHTVMFTVTDAAGNRQNCTSLFTIVRRVEIAPESPVVVAVSACKYPVVVTRAVRIDNSGGNFGSGVMMWTASTSAAEISLLTASGQEGDALRFSIDGRRLPTGTHTRSITINAYNSMTMTPASNAPYTLTVRIENQPGGSVTVTQAVGSAWTPFLNSSGQTVAEVKSNAGPISSFTVNMVPCSLPQGLGRVRYVRRSYALTSSASNLDVDVRLYYSNTEAMPLVSKPEALTVYNRPWNVWTSLGGVSQPLQNMVELQGLTSLGGPFALAHPWFPKQDANAELPHTVLLEQNYPNPFNPVTTVDFSIPERRHVRIGVYDMFGRRVALIADGVYDEGRHNATFDASGLPSGTYNYMLESGDVVMQRSMTLMK
ncbi:MAG: S8 family serine peptidase [Bacteroidota bacterium]|nr:S8 family serine peptidase [Bacteroidota bacterium]